MIKSFLISTLILLCTALVEAAILSNITMLPAVPDLSLLCVLYFSIQNGRLMGELTGFASGLILDFLSAGPFGLNCLFRTIIGFAGGLFTKTINTEGVFVPMLLGFCATIAKAAFLWLVSLLYPSGVLAYSPLSWLFLFELGANTLLAPFVFRFLEMFRKSVVLRPEEVR